MKLEIPLQILGKYTNIKFNGNPSSWSQVFPCGRTDIRKLIVTFRNFANASENSN
jgi:hypothetical protein